jgi:hypothetical protein
MVKNLLLLLGSLSFSCLLWAQAPGPIFSANAKAVQGVGPGSWTYGANVNLYVSNTGSDETGNGSSGNPYQTIARALRDVPMFVSHHYVINLAAGTYREQVNIEGRYFGATAAANFNRAAVELRGDAANPDDYVISGADAGSPTVPVRDYAVVASFAHVILNGVSLQYAVNAGFLQQGGVSVIYQSTFRHFTANNASTGFAIHLAGFCELRGNPTVSDASNGVEVEGFSQLFGYYAGYDYLNTGFPVNTTFTITGIAGVGLGVYDQGYYALSNTTAIFGTGAAGSKGIFIGSEARMDTETTTVSDFETAVFAEVLSQVEINDATFSNATTGVRLRKQSVADWLNGDPTFVNVTTPYDLTEGSWVTTPTQTLFTGSMKSTGAVSISAGGTDQNITLTPSGTGYTILNGKVGMGIASPLENLHIHNSTTAGPIIRLTNSQTGTANTDGVVLGFDDGADPYGYFWNNENSGLYFGTNNTSRLLITADGNIGVGKSSGINQQLDVAKSIASGLNTVTFSATPTFDASLGNTQKITLAGNVTASTLSNASAGEQINFIVCQDATGNWTFVWPTNVKGGMTVGSTAATCSAQPFIFDGSNAYALSPGVANM